MGKRKTSKAFPGKPRKTIRGGRSPTPYRASSFVRVHSDENRRGRRIRNDSSFPNGYDDPRGGGQGTRTLNRLPGT